MAASTRRYSCTLAIFALLTLAHPSAARSVNISNAWLLPQNDFPVFYRHFRDRVTWFEADAVCQFHHAQLATVETSNQFEAIRGYLKELDVAENVWIGLKRNNDASEFTWTNYQPLAKSVYFREEIPHSSEPLCVVTDPTANFKWHTMHCGGPEVASFVCELPVPSWATKNNGCMTNSVESLTITFLPERPALQLTKECSISVSKNVTCKGNMKQSEILEALSCPGFDKLSKVQYKVPKPTTTETFKIKTTTQESDIIEDYAIEMATIPQYNDEAFQSISKVIGHGSGGIVNLPQEMSYVQEPIRSINRGLDSNGIEPAIDVTTPPPSSTTSTSTVSAKISPTTIASTTIPSATPSTTSRVPSTTAQSTSTASKLLPPSTTTKAIKIATTLRATSSGPTTGTTTTTAAGTPSTTKRIENSPSLTSTSTMKPTSTTFTSKATVAPNSNGTITTTASTTVPVVKTSTSVPTSVKRNLDTTTTVTTASPKASTTTHHPSRVPFTIATTKSSVNTESPTTTTTTTITIKPTTTTTTTTATDRPIHVYKKIDLPQIPKEYDHRQDIKTTTTTGTLNAASVSSTAATTTGVTGVKTSSAAAITQRNGLTESENPKTVAQNGGNTASTTPSGHTTVTVNHHASNYDSYTDRPSHSRHIVRPAQQHHTYPYILYRLLG